MPVQGLKAGTKGVSGLAKHHRRRGTRGLNDSGFTSRAMGKGDGGQALQHGLQGVAGVIPYIALPTLLGLDGPVAALVGSLSTWLLGAGLNWPGMQTAAFVLPAVHGAYVYLQEPAKLILGDYFWRLDPNAPIAGTNTLPATEPNKGFQGLREYMSYYPSQMNDVYLKPNPGMPQLGPGPGTNVNGLAGYDPNILVQPDYFGGRAR